MCKQQRWIINKYDGSKHFIKCGKCEACKQEKAIERTNRVRSEFQSNRTAVFATLSYMDSCVPYIKNEDASNFIQDCIVGDKSATLPVYRDYDIHGSNHGRVVEKNLEPIAVLSSDDLFYHGKELRFDMRDVKDVESFKNLHYQIRKKDYWHDGKIGVLHYDDIRNFLKRLKVNLQRWYNYDEHYEVFYCGEYGGDYDRPHFHVFFSVPEGDYQLFKQAIIKTWWFSDHSVLEREVELARDPCSYLASYVNSDSVLPSLLSDFAPFKPNHKYSHGFGMSLGDFSYDAVKEAYSRRDLMYDSIRNTKSGVAINHVPIPSYVINRYFPKFKGFGRLAPDEIQDVLVRPESIAYYRTKCGLSWDDCNKIVRHVRNTTKRLSRYHKSEQDWFEWICMYKDVHNLHYANCLKASLQNVTFFHHWNEHYLNIQEFRNILHKYEYGYLGQYHEVVQDLSKVYSPAYIDLLFEKIYLRIGESVFGEQLKTIDFGSRVPTLKSLIFPPDWSPDPNYWRHNLNKHNKLVDAWHLYKKNKRISSETLKIKKYG